MLDRVRFLGCCLGVLLQPPACVRVDCASGDLTCNPVAALLRLRPPPGPINQPCFGPGIAFPSFHSYLSSGSSLSGQAVCAPKDGGLVAVGQATGGTTLQGYAPLIPHSGSLEDALVVKWDGTGNVAWFTYLGTGTSGITINKIAETSDGGLVLLGYMNGPEYFAIGGLPPVLAATSGDDTDIFVARLRADGSLAWHTALGGGGAGNEYDAGGLVVAGDGSIYISGTGGSGAPTSMGSVSARVPFTVGDNNNILLAKLTSGGELIWFRYVGGGTGGSYHAESLALASDGSLFVGGFVQDAAANTIDGQGAILPYNAADDRNAIALKFDPEGAVQWLTYFGGGGAGYGYVNSGATALDDGSAVFSGDAAGAGVSTIGGVTALIPYSPGDSANGLVWKLNAEGVLQWFTYLGGGAGGYYNLADARRAADGGLFVSGSCQNGGSTIGSVNALSAYDSTTAVLLAGLSPSGNLAWFTYASEGAGGQYYSNGVAATSDGGVIAVGFSREGAATMDGKSPLNPYDTGATENLFMVKVDSQGRL